MKETTFGYLTCTCPKCLIEPIKEHQHLVKEVNSQIDFLCEQFNSFAVKSKVIPYD